jgi:putative ABC transport system permease protein
VKPIVAQEQVKLGPARCVQLALTGMSYRMFRSLVTIAILALAVAFLVHMLAYGLMSGATQAAAYQQLRADREAGEMVTRLTTADQPKTVLEVMVAGRDQRRLAEYRRWAGDDAAFDAALEAADDAGRFADYLAVLPAASYAALVGDESPAALLAQLNGEDRLQRFETTVKDLGLAPPLGDWPTMRELALQRWPEARALARRISEAHRQAIAQVRRQFDNQPAAALFRSPPEGLLSAMQQAGFEVDAADLEHVAHFVTRTDDLAAFSRMITNDRVRQALARRLRLSKAEISTDRTLNYLDSTGKAQWFAGVLAENDAPDRLDAPRLLELASNYRRQEKLEAAAGDEAPEADGSFMGLPASTLYLIGLSFIVCVVGVANAMLMSVTERFTEIATMKCLGAMDRFVMMMFVFEAAIQGLVGGLAGLVLGIVLALLRGLLDFGTLLGYATSAAGQIGMAAVLSLAVGILLATFAAVGPSWVAARLAPMEAMRVE